MENMKDVTAFMYEHLNGFLATAGNDNIPHVRVIQFMMEDEGKYYFATSSKKNVSKQLRQNNYAEYITSTFDFKKNIRMSGEIFFANDLELGEKILNAYEYLREMYKTPDNPTFEIFYFEHGTIISWDENNTVTEFDF